MIIVDAQGKPSFTYWRSDSATRRMFAPRDNAEVLAAGAEAATCDKKGGAALRRRTPRGDRHR
ncbi:hypothetical protein [Sphingomonas sp.]|uniref:hypothetical protein n=1 Tax=Sphingomonas sp. TaxID=28214 RepID=UPI003D6CE3C8